LTPEDVKNLTETLKMLGELIESKPNEWLPLYAALGGAIAGAIASFFPTFMLERYREKKYSRRILASLLSEISALLEIVQHRGYHKSIKDKIEYLRTQPVGSTCSFTVHVPEHYSRIYQENCANIGAIDEFYSQKIVIFHQLIDSIVQDVEPGGIISSGAKIGAFEEIDIIFTRAIQIGNELLQAHNHHIQTDSAVPLR